MDPKMKALMFRILDTFVIQADSIGEVRDAIVEYLEGEKDEREINVCTGNDGGSS